MNTVQKRVGNFTSSEIGALMSNGRKSGEMGEPAYTYIDECNMERRLGRSITDEVDARPLTWGKFMEPYVFDLMGTDYEHVGTETLLHPEFSCWAGSPDLKKWVSKTQIKVGDIKAPKTLKSFCRLSDCLRATDVREALLKVKSGSKKIGEIYYWQLVSNAILIEKTNPGVTVENAELVVFMPFKSQLDEIRSRAFNLDNPDEQKKVLWIYGSSDEELPHLIDGGYYNNISVLSFAIPQADKEALEERVSMASNELQEFHKIKAA